MHPSPQARAKTGTYSSAQSYISYPFCRSGIYCVILLCGSMYGALRKAPLSCKVESYTEPVLGKRHWGCGGLEPLRSLGSPTGFGDFCHQKSRAGSDGSAAGGGCSDLSEWPQLGDWRVSGANDDRAVVATGSGVATTRGWMTTPHRILGGSDMCFLSLSLRLRRIQLPLQGSLFCGDQ